MSKVFVVGVALVFLSGAMHGKDQPPIEETIVSAQRIEENLQDVPIATSVFGEATIDERQIIGLADIQLSAPNVVYADHSFARGRFVIRGVGRQDNEGNTENGVSVHLNGMPIPAEARLTLLDAQRLEVLRGPQGTLYGRNATGGAVNIITNQPSTNERGGSLALEYGDYDHRRVQGIVNLPLTDSLALRIAGMGLKRDGFTKNLAVSDIPTVDDDLDGRDLWFGRASVKWLLSDTFTLNGLYSRFQEDDDRLRNAAIACRQNTLPTLGCLPGQSGFDVPHPHGFGLGFIASDLGARAPGARDEATGLVFDVPRPPGIDFRRQHTDFEPIYERMEEIVGLNLEWDAENFLVSVSGVYFKQDLLSRQDDQMNVGFVFDPTPAVPSGLWPTSALPRNIGDLRADPQCNFNNGSAGVRGGCTYPADLTRHFTYDSTNSSVEQTTLEARFHSRWQGPVNLLAGVSYLTNNGARQFDRVDNVLDQLSLVGSPLAGFPFPVVSPIWDVATDRHDLDSYSVFGELYWQATNSIKATLGVRYNHDRKTIEDSRQSNLGGFDVTAGSSDAEFIRFSLLQWWFGQELSPQLIPLTDLYGATQAIQEAASFDERLAVAQLVPLAMQPNEARLLSGEPSKKTWEGITARAGLTWSPRPERMVYAFYSRGYKPGAFVRFANPSTESETVDSFEFGAKGRWLDETVLANGAAFWSKSNGLQLGANSAAGSNTTQNFDARSWGVELELEWRPQFLLNLGLSVAYGWLQTELESKLVFNTEDPLQGDPDYTLLRDDLAGLYIARTTDVLPFVDQAVALGLANPAANTVYPNGVPSLFAIDFLNAVGVETLAGFPVNVKGNDIPYAPRHNVNVGVSYDWFFSVGSIHARWDYYWQAHNFARVFNSRDNRIDSWEQHNVSIAYAAANGRWHIKAWARNITDADNVNGQFAISATTGNARSLLLNDPRLFGVTVQFSFGDLGPG